MIDLHNLEAYQQDSQVTQKRELADQRNRWIQPVSLVLAVILHAVVFSQWDEHQMIVKHHPNKPSYIEVALIPSVTASEPLHPMQPKKIAAKEIKKTKPRIQPKPIVHAPLPIKKKPVIKVSKHSRHKVIKKTPTTSQTTAHHLPRAIEKPIATALPASEVKSDSAPQRLSQAKHQHMLEQAYLNHLMSIIKTHKKYPYSARRRHIEGNIKVLFTVDSTGKISDIHINGKSRVLIKATMNAIQDSLPFPAPSSELKTSIHSRFMMQYKLH